MGDLNELLARVKAATGPDRELDYAFWVAFEPDGAEASAKGKVPLPWLWLVTSSTDAALALTDKLLNTTPGVQVYPVEMTLTSVGLKGPWRAAMWTGGEADGHYHTAPTAPLAILAALLTALSLDTNKGDGV